jgi:hypothetical protein
MLIKFFASSLVEHKMSFIKRLTWTALGTMFVGSFAFADTVTCVDAGRGVQACSDGTTIVDVGNGVYSRSDGTTIVKVSDTVYAGSDGTTLVDVGNGVYAGSNGTTVVVVDRSGNRGGLGGSRGSSSDDSSSQYPSDWENTTVVGCSYHLLADSMIAKTYNETGETYQIACQNARASCSRNLEGNKKSLKDYELACYWERDPNNPVNRFKQAWVMCGAARKSYQECSLPNQSSGVSIQKAYGKVFGSFNTLEDLNSYFTSLGGTSDVVLSLKRKMVENCGPQGKKWGVTSDKQRLWVKDNCRGAFMVNYSIVQAKDNKAPQQCDKVQLDNCLKFGGGNACYKKWCN